MNCLPKQIFTLDQIIWIALLPLVHRERSKLQLRALISALWSDEDLIAYQRILEESVRSISTMRYPVQRPYTGMIQSRTRGRPLQFILENK